MSHKRDRNKVIDITPEVSIKEKAIADLRKQGFNPEQMTEAELASFALMGIVGNEIVDAIDAMGQVVYDYLGGEDETV